MDPRHDSLQRLSRAARRAGLYLRLDDALGRLFSLLPLPLLYAVTALTAVKLSASSPLEERRLLWGWLVPWAAVLAGVVHAWRRARPRELGSLALDRHYGLSDRVTTALALARVHPAERPPLAELAIDDALERAKGLKPRRAASLHLPREVPLVGFLLLALGAISLFEVRTVRTITRPLSPEPLTMSSDDLELFRKLNDALEQRTQDSEAATGVRQFNQLLEDLAEHRLDRTEAFRRLGELERKLQRGVEADQESLGEGLQAIARELEKSELARRTGQVLRQQRLQDAEQALRELAEKLRRQRAAPSRAEIERLRDALKRASRASIERQERIRAERDRVLAERKSLFTRTQQDKTSPRDEEQRSQAERRLMRLNRDQQNADKASPQLSELDKQLAQAAEDLLKALGKGAEDLDSAAQNINRMARDQMSSRQKEDLLRRLRELKELMRQQGQGGQKHLERLQRFAERARGQRGPGGQQRGQASSDRQGRSAGQSRQLTWGSKLDSTEQVLPLEQQSSAQNTGAQKGSAGDPSAGGEPGGREWGVGHDENLRGETQELRGKTKDVSAAGIDTGQGTASSEVIMGAAQRGFAGAGYQKVFQDYQTVAEQVLNHDEIPAGYRFYVRRYFQLIRPRN